MSRLLLISPAVSKGCFGSRGIAPSFFRLSSTLCGNKHCHFSSLHSTDSNRPSVNKTCLRSIHLTKKTEEIIVNPENAVWDPVREFNFRRFSIFDSLGLDLEDKESDDFMARYFMFFGVSLISVVTFFWFRYRPSYTGFIHDWAKREAYRLVAEREEAGVPVIDIDYAPVDQLLPFLPPDHGMYTCDVETDFTYYDQVQQSFPPPKPANIFSQRPKILGPFEEHQKVMNDGSKAKLLN